MAAVGASTEEERPKVAVVRLAVPLWRWLCWSACACRVPLCAAVVACAIADAGVGIPWLVQRGSDDGRCATFAIEQEDHTLANALRYTLMRE